MADPTYSRNIYQRMPPSQRTLAQAREEGVDTRSMPAVVAWLAKRR